ncbi:BLUF domain-containing protein [Brevundimonas sp. SORGH_AS_0993]|uniref:BLUF domain-containing protein n=1 Tax=Brevundimonas sp. SORGH_AS_0993 TaxID=3041794 RepID=UPI00278925B0|nr:BLUF domain-containing protein [Brevundimonas sp. SORGH_AS_0993]MDQ1154665.1 hypothetical protein [Brevundimonas sp. SORGH_AS_0993]
MSLFRIVYVSDAVGGVGDKLMVLVDIIGVSDRNNRRDHITGVLMRHDGRFFQAIEGRRVDLDRLMTRIRADRRHANIRILSDRPVQTRLFADWALAQVDASPALERLLAEDAGAPALTARIERLLIDTSQALVAA